MAQEPEHSIDLERLEGYGELLLGWHELIRQVYDKQATLPGDAGDFQPERVGLLPYAAIDVYERLKVAFGEYRKFTAASQPTEAVEQNIEFYAGWFGHYVGDGSNPLHTTIHYDDWAGPNPHNERTERGIHSEFETEFVSRNLSAMDFASFVHNPGRLKHPFEDFIQYIRQSHAHVERLYQLG